MTLEQTTNIITAAMLVMTCCIIVSMIGFKLLPKLATNPPWWMSRRAKNFLGRFVGYAECRCCHDSWNWKKPHVTEVNEDHGVFPLCEDCWEELATPEAREPFYNELFDEWLNTAPHHIRIRIEQEDRPAALRAVYDGK